MEIIVSGRRGGKTHLLLAKLLVDDTGVMLCATRKATISARSEYIRLLCAEGVRAQQAELRAERQIITGSPRRGHNGNIYVDNLCDVLSNIFETSPFRIRAVTDNALVKTPQGKRFEVEYDNPHI